MFPLKMRSFTGLLLIICLAGLVQAQEPVTRGRMVYYLDVPGYLEKVDKSLVDARSRLQDLLADSLDFTAEVHLVTTEEHFRKLIGDEFPDWGAAAAVPSQNLIVVKSPDHFNIQRPLGELMAHEYAHLALHKRVSMGRIPRWFDEGLAMMVSAEWDMSESATMSLAVITSGFVPLQQIEWLNNLGESRARLAYAQSYLAVQYMYKEYGTELVNVFLDTLDTGATLNTALLASTGSDFADFEQEYRVYLRQRFNILVLVMDSMYFWIIMVIIFIVGAVLTIRRRKKYYREWEEQEKLASTDFDYGDPDNPEELDDDEPWRK